MAVGILNNREWLQQLQRFGLKPGLERTQKVLAELGNPEQSLQFLHVAGTNGKGSVCAFLTHLFARHYSVGTFTSPAFDGYRGRFVVNGAEMTDDEFESTAAKVRGVCSQVSSDDPLTEFEVLTVIAILYFAEKRVDIVVWETGLGGRYDATNVVRPLVAGITNVGLDHTEILGDTVAKIAFDKAGIIKSGVPVVTGATGEALDVIRMVADRVDAPLFVRGVHFTEINAGETSRMHYRGILEDLFDVPIGLFGLHQLRNASVALAMYELACAYGGFRTLEREVHRDLMATVQWPGRFELLHWRGAVVILDGAHNPDGVKAMGEAIGIYSKANHAPENGWTMVVGMLGDKDVATMVRLGLPYANRVIVTAPKNERAKKPEELANIISECRGDIPVHVVATVQDAILQATSEGQWVCCWGSLYTVHEARKAIKQSEQFMM